MAESLFSVPFYTSVESSLDRAKWSLSSAKRRIEALGPRHELFLVDVCPFCIGTRHSSTFAERFMDVTHTVNM